MSLMLCCLFVSHRAYHLSEKIKNITKQENTETLQNKKTPKTTSIYVASVLCELAAWGLTSLCCWCMLFVLSLCAPFVRKTKTSGVASVAVLGLLLNEGSG